MKSKFILFVSILWVTGSLLSQELSPYIKVGESDKAISEVSKEVVANLKSGNFEVLGTYNVGNSNEVIVIAFTRADLKNAVVKVKDRGALSAVMKIGLVKEGGKTTISYTNPQYITRAYLPKGFNSCKAVINEFSANLKSSLAPLGSEFKAFGGSIKADKLAKYHYKILMPYFTNPVSLREYGSFKEGLNTITANLKAKKGKTQEVYRLVFPDKQIAVFGIGLLNDEDGESYFLPKIGVAHAAAMPYEIILQGKEVTMLHGKYRFALHWPDLTMGTFMKIMSTPGDIKDTLEGVCEK